MTFSPVPDGPHNDAWKGLLPEAFAVIDEVERTRHVAFPVQIGGGSMLLRRYRHRLSRDLDLFVRDMQLVRWCSPRFNDVAADLPDYHEDRASVKLIIGMQEIDIIASAVLFEDEAADPANLLGRQVLIERPREILAKKLYYRGRNLQARDIFDFAAVAACEPDEAARVLDVLDFADLDNVRARLPELEPLFQQELAEKVNPYPEFQDLVGSCFETFSDIITGWYAQLQQDDAAVDCDEEHPTAGPDPTV